ncbi:hypothetical protein SLA2020_027750 [Shorea laevis]
MLDSENDHIYHSELFTLTKWMSRGEPKKLNFMVPIFQPNRPQYYIHAISDYWQHSESFDTISLQNLTLPEVCTTHTDPLDLKPLPIVHVLYHTVNNVLLEAPTGSGKTISAKLAMLRHFNAQPDMKVIYIAPVKAIVRKPMNDRTKHLLSQLGKEMVMIKQSRS